MKRKGANQRASSKAMGTRGDDKGPHDAAELVVAPGASVGGIEALEGCFGGLPEADRRASVVILYQDSDKEGYVAEVLQRNTPVPVERVTNATRLEPGRVYVVPPGQNFEIRDGTLSLTPKQDEEALRRSESRYRAIFDTVGVSIWEEDFSEAKAALDALKAAGVTDIRRYLEEHPAFVEQMLDRVRILDVNEATLKMYGASSKEEVLGPLRRVFLPEGLPVFRDELVALAEEKAFLASTVAFQTLRGECIEIAFTFTAADPPTYSHVLVSLLDITERKQAVEALRELNATLEQRVEERTRQVRELMRALAMAEQEERRRIAQILHDDLQQQLYGLSITLNLLRNPRSEEEAHHFHDQAGTILEQAINLTRTLSTELSPPVLQSDDLEETLQWLALRKREQYDLEVDVEMRGAVRMPEHNLRVLLYQVLREVLFNVVKHAGVDRARVTAWEEAGGVVVQVEDEGVGFDVEAQAEPGSEGGGFGLSNVREQLGLVGGRFHLDSTPGAGTRVTLSIPLPQEEDERT